MTWVIIRTEDGTADKMKRLLGNALHSASQMKFGQERLIRGGLLGKEQARNPILEGFGHNIRYHWSFSGQQYKPNLSHHSHPREQHR